MKCLKHFITYKQQLKKEGGSLGGGGGNVQIDRILPAWYCHLEEFFLIEKFTLKRISPACEKQFPFGAENVKETPAYI